MNRLVVLLSLLAASVAAGAVESTTTSSNAASDQTYVREKISEIQAKLESSDRRNEQRFADSEKAVNAALQAADKAVGAALQAAKEAVAKAEAANEKRLDSVNEFRKTLSDQAAGFASKEAVASINQRLDKAEGALAGSGQVWSIVVAVFGAIIGVIGVIFLVMNRRTAQENYNAQRRVDAERH